MDQRISLVTLGVTDLPRARSFYEALGWGGTTGAFADPDGYVWEVAHNPGWTLGSDGAVRI
jgi:predicted lactoylglutathione lyase